MLAGNKFRDQKNSSWLSRKTESIAIRQVLRFFYSGAHLLRDHFMTFSPFRVQLQHVAGERRLLRCFISIDGRRITTFASQQPQYRVKSNLDKLISSAYITPRVETTLNAKGKLLEREMR